MTDFKLSICEGYFEFIQFEGQVALELPIFVVIIITASKFVQSEPEKLPVLEMMPILVDPLQLLVELFLEPKPSLNRRIHR